MRRGTGITLTAAALSITVGVLVGAVITIGTHARSQSLDVPPASFATSGDVVNTADPATDDFDSVGEDGVPLSGDPASSWAPPVSSLPAPVMTPTPVASTGAVRSTTKPPPRTGTPPPTKSTAKPRVITGTTSRPALVMTTVTVMASTSSIPTSRPDPTTLPGPTTHPSTTTTIGRTTQSSRPPPAPPGQAAPIAGRPCQDLGDKGTVAGGSNVFCQTDFATRTLAWRAVVDGGGCLSKRMRGIGVDGRNYACRADGPGLDHWHPGP